jgi:hypothetical protein
VRGLRGRGAGFLLAPERTGSGPNSIHSDTMHQTTPSRAVAATYQHALAPHHQVRRYMHAPYTRPARTKDQGSSRWRGAYRRKTEDGPDVDNIVMYIYKDMNVEI